jgi:hypothetical protein
MGWSTSGPLGNNLYAFNASSGGLLWSYATGSGISSSPAVANGAVHVGSGDGNIYAFDLSGGSSAAPRPNPAKLVPNHHLKTAASPLTRPRRDTHL